jgi:hypothetical protein
LIGGGFVLVVATQALAAEGMYWVIGKRASNTCEIVTANPLIDGDVWFGDGPYKSKEDAQLARSTIRACPKLDPAVEAQGGAKKAD